MRAELQQLVSSWEQRVPNLKVSIEVTRLGDIALDSLVVPDQYRGKGYGRKLMKELLDFAQKHNARVTLTPTAGFGPQHRERLEKFYKGLGFIYNAGDNLDYRVSDAMIWTPKTQVKEATKVQATKAAQELQSVLGKEQLSMFVKALSNASNNPVVQELLLAGRTDGFPEDERVSIGMVNGIAPVSLLPTQAEIGSCSCLDVILELRYPDDLSEILAGKQDIAFHTPTMILDSKWVLDGHHRWAVASIANPDCGLRCIDLEFPVVVGPDGALRILHMAIAALSGQVDLPYSELKGFNLYDPTVTENHIYEYCKKKLSAQPFATRDALVGMFMEAGLIGELTEVSLCEHLARNAYALQQRGVAEGASTRRWMPQPDKAQGSVKAVLSALAGGQINWIKPRAEDISEEKI